MLSQITLILKTVLSDEAFVSPELGRTRKKTRTLSSAFRLLTLGSQPSSHLVFTCPFSAGVNRARQVTISPSKVLANLLRVQIMTPLDKYKMSKQQSLKVILAGRRGIVLICRSDQGHVEVLRHFEYLGRHHQVPLGKFPQTNKTKKQHHKPMEGDRPAMEQSHADGGPREQRDSRLGTHSSRIHSPGGRCGVSNTVGNSTCKSQF